MDTIIQKLTPLYVQYEAIQAQQKIANSPNHTEVYVPVGPMGVGVPIWATTSWDKKASNRRCSPACSG